MIVASTEHTARFPNNPTALAEIRRFVREHAAPAGFTEDEIDQIELAVDEACANVMEHAYGEDDPDPGLDLCVKIEFDRFTIVVADHGTAFDPTSVAPPDLEAHMAEFRVGGLGIFLMRTLMDHVDYRRDQGENVVRLTKMRVKRAP